MKIRVFIGAGLVHPRILATGGVDLPLEEKLLKLLRITINVDLTVFLFFSFSLHFGSI